MVNAAPHDDMFNSNGSRTRIALTLVLVVAATSSAIAQEVSPPALCAPSATSSPFAGPGVSVAVVDSVSLAPFVGRTLSEALTARVPGVSVMRSSGVAGTGSRVRVRGPGGILLTEQPLLFIDGIRVDDEQQSIALGLDGGQAPSRLDDMSTDEIACIVVLRGPSATARHGTDAAGGVIHVVTRSSPQPPDSSRQRVSGFLEGGATSDVGGYPANFGSSSLAPNGRPCSRAADALGQCELGAVRSWSPLDADSPFRTAPRLNAGLRLTVASSSRFLFAANGRAMVDGGALENNDHQRYAAGAQASFRPESTLAVSGSFWFLGGHTELPQAAPSYSILSGALLGNSVDDPVRRGYRDFPLWILDELGLEQRLRRIGGTVRVDWAPVRWLAMDALVGREDSRAQDEQIDPSVQFPIDGGFTVGPPRAISKGERRVQRSSVDVSATSRFQTGSLRLTTELGAQYFADERRSMTHTRSLPGTLLFEDYAWSRGEGTTTGIVARQEIIWNERRFLEVGVRHDWLHRLAVEMKNPTYPFANLAWDLGREGLAGPGRTLSSLKARAAYGESGDSRPYDAAARLAIAVPIGVNASTDWTVQRTREIEAGIDVGMASDRVMLSATYFSKKTTDAPVTGPIPPGAGFPTTSGISNGAEWRTTGTELSLQARLLDRERARAGIDITFTALDNEVLTLGEVPPLVSNVSRIWPGYPLYGLWTFGYHYSDANGDGVIVPAEVVADTGVRYMGSPVPTRELGVIPHIELGQSVRLTALIDYRGGFRTYNFTEQLRCVLVCADLYVSDVPLSRQARAVAPGRAQGEWIEDASFARLREVSLSWTLPSAWSGVVGARAASITFAGHNLATWTDYSGLDPEVTMYGQSRIDQQDFMTLAPPRTVMLRLDARW